MASTTWRIQGLDTLGHDLALRQIAPWSATGLAAPTEITSTFAPTTGNIGALLIDDGTECVFSKEDVQKPGFRIEITFSEPVDLWGFRFAGPSGDTWPSQHLVATGALAATLRRVQWGPGGALSPAPTGPINFSNEVGQWVSQTAAGVRNWFGCGISADGRTLLGAASGGTLWLSKDRGATWVAQTAAGTRNWEGCAVSADGSVMLAAASGGIPHLSKDGGATWVAQTAVGSRTWRTSAVSADGNTLLLTTYSGTPWLSKDAGTTWVAQTALGTANWFGSGVSADGNSLLCVAQGGTPWLSKDAGVTWVPQTAAGARTWRGCAISADGLTLLAVDSGGTPWLSKNAGTTWAAQTAAGTNDWYACAVSANGQTLLAVAAGTEPKVSKDGGTTWVPQTGAGSAPWVACAITPDGLSLFGAQFGGSLSVVFGADPIYLDVPVRGFAVQSQLVVSGEPPSAQELGLITRAETQMFRDAEFGGNGRVYGTVERKNTPANVPMRRRVRLHRSRDGLLVRETWSKDDGSYEFTGVSMQYEYDTIAWDNEMSFRSVVANNLKPEVM